MFAYIRKVMLEIVLFQKLQNGSLAYNFCAAYTKCAASLSQDHYLIVMALRAYFLTEVVVQYDAIGSPCL